MIAGLAEEAAAIAAALQAREPRAGLARVVAIDGRAASGKSTLAAQVATELGAPCVHLEDLYGGWDGLADGVTRLVADVLLPLAAGGSAFVPRYDWHARLWREPLLLDGPADVVVEGVGAGALAAAPFVSLMVWIDVPRDLRYERAMARDGELFARNWERWAEQEDRYLAADRSPERADIVLRAPAPAAAR
jgi:para-aminobenzoate synthetase